MCRFGKAILIALACTLACSSGAWGQVTPRDASRADETLMHYLERSGLHELLATHLERRLAVDNGRDTTELARRLANAYAELHARADTIEEQRLWKDKGLALLDRVPQADSIEFRLSFARESYARIERLAEQSLLRLDEAPSRDRVRESLIDLLETLEAIVAKSSARVRAYQRQLESARAVDARLIDEALKENQRHRSQASYLAGYTALYIARLAPEPSAPASRAIRHFATVLDADGGGVPGPLDISANLLEFDHVARSALGIAYASALKPDMQTAEAWFEQLEIAPSIPEAVAEELPASRLRAYARANRWSETLELMNARADEPLRALEARRLAVIVFEGEARVVEADARDALAQRALSDLIARNETGHVLQIVARYDISSINPQGFVGTYVRALKRYESTRAAHRGDGGNVVEPTESSDLAAEYARAGASFTNALETDDAEAYATAHGSVRMLAGLSYFYAGPRRDNLELASEQFTLAHEKLAGDAPARAANALWMAIRSLELHLEKAPDSAGAESLRNKRAQLLSRFLERYPDHQRAHALVYKRATSGDLPKEEAVDDLLRIPRTASLYDASRRRAARLLYDLITDESREPDPWRRTLFMDITESILESDLRASTPTREGEARPEDARRAGLHARRLFEIALLRPPRDEQRAQRALDALAALVSMGVLDIESIEAELEYRRAKLLASKGDLEGARAASDRAGELDPRFRGAGNRLLFREAAQAYRASRGASEEDRAEAASRVLETGRPILRRLSGESGEITFEQPSDASLVHHVAMAAQTLWTVRRDDGARDLARLLFRVLVREYPDTITYIRPAARLEIDAGNPRDSLPLWRRILSATPPLTDAWLEAKHATIRIHLSIDPPRARRIYEQFRTLHPDFDDPTWKQKFEALAQQLPGGDA